MISSSTGIGGLAGAMSFNSTCPSGPTAAPLAGFGVEALGVEALGVEDRGVAMVSDADYETWKARYYDIVSGRPDTK